MIKKSIKSKLFKKYFDKFRFKLNQNNPYLISFPRTGSHWLRMIIELYFERPLLTRTFFFKNKNNYILLHNHDIELKIRRRRVIYLYRNPVDTIFSKIKYENVNINNEEEIKYWLDLYCKHLKKWLIAEDFTKEKVVIKFENMKTNPEKEFKKICNYFRKDFDKSKLRNILEKLDKNKVKKKSNYNKKVVKISRNYEKQRDEFKNKYKKFIKSYINKNYNKLSKLLNYE